jgi:hypothetical protein
MKTCPKCGKELYIGRRKDVLFLLYNSKGVEEDLYLTFNIEHCPECLYTKAEEE